MVEHIILTGNKVAMEQTPKRLDEVRERIRLTHYSIRTEKSYVDWIRRFILFHGKRHPRDVGAPKVGASLLYGAGLRLMECVRLRIKGVEFSRCERLVRGGKGARSPLAVA